MDAERHTTACSAWSESAMKEGSLMKEEDRKCSSRLTTSKRQAIASSAGSSASRIRMSQTLNRKEAWLLWYFTASSTLSSSPHWMHCTRKARDSPQTSLIRLQRWSHTSPVVMFFFITACSTAHESAR